MLPGMFWALWSYQIVYSIVVYGIWYIVCDIWYLAYSMGPQCSSIKGLMVSIGWSLGCLKGTCTWTPKVYKMMAFWALFGGFGLVSYILLGSR